MGPNKNDQKWPITGDKLNIHEEVREGLTCGRRTPLLGKKNCAYQQPIGEHPSQFGMKSGDMKPWEVV